MRGRGLFGSLGELYAYVRRTAYGYFLRAPGVRATVRKQVDAALAKTAAKMLPGADDATRLLALPAKGLPADEVETRLAKLADMDHVRWEDGMVSGAVYHGEKELLQVQAKAYERFTVANPIHPDVFPGVRRMEAEVIAMVLSLFNAPPGAAGLSTSGGTESILLACLSARQKAYVERGITEPEMSVTPVGPRASDARTRKSGAGGLGSGAAQLTYRNVGSSRRRRTPHSTRRRRTLRSGHVSSTARPPTTRWTSRRRRG